MAETEHMHKALGTRSTVELTDATEVGYSPERTVEIDENQGHLDVDGLAAPCQIIWNSH